MNYSIVSPKIVCNQCSHEQWADAKHCSACGISFVWGEPNAWERKVYASATTEASPAMGKPYVPTLDNPYPLNMGIIEVDDDIDLKIDKCFAELRMTAKTKTYKLVKERETE